MTRALERGIAVVEALERNGAASLAALNRATGLSKATLLRLLATLIEKGWVYRRLNDGQYALSLDLGGPRQAAVNWAHRAKACGPQLDALTRETGLPADLTAVLGPGALEVIESTRRRRRGGVDPFVVGFRPSMVLSSPGRAVLMAASPAGKRRHLEVVLKSDVPKERIHISSGLLEQELAASRRRGYARREAGYWPDSSLFGEEPMDIAVPIHAGGEPLASLSLVWPADRFSAEDVAARHLNALKAAAGKLAAVFDP